MTFLQAFLLLGNLEGGYTVDDGGPTNYGVTQQAWDLYRKKFHSDAALVKNATQEELKDFYWFTYWSPLRLDQVHTPADFVIFQWAVDCEGGGDEGLAVRDAQLCCGAEPDGIMGPLTLKAISSVPVDKFEECYLGRQEMHYREWAAKNPALPLGGWLDRIAKVRNIVKSEGQA